MRRYIKFLFIALLLINQYIIANNSTVHFATAYINWQNVGTQFSDTLRRSAFGFDHAIYPSDNTLPYYNVQIEVDKSKNYTVEVSNIKMLALSSDELAAFPFDVELNAEPIVQTQFIENLDAVRLQVLIFPFVKIEGNYFKLMSFDYTVNESVKAQKQSSATSNFLHQYAQNSVLANGRFVKIRVANTGIHRITFEDLVAMGVNPQNVRVFGYGGNVLDQYFANPRLDDLPEVAIHVEKGNDGVFNAGDYILFYAQGINKWTYDRMRSMFTHTRNSYSDFGYYFVTSDAGVGKTIETLAKNVPNDAVIVDVNEFVDYKVHEQELQSLVFSGKEFYGETFSDRTTLTFNFNFPNVVKTNTTKIRLDVAAAASAVSTFNLTLAGTTRGVSLPAKGSDNYEKAKGANAVFTFTPNADDFSLRLDYVKPNSSATGYLNYITVNALRSLKMTGAAMQFQSDQNIDNETYNRYTLADASADIHIWDVTQPHNATRVATVSQNNNQSFIDTNNNVRTYIAVNTKNGGAFPKPEVVGQVANQNLHALQGIDFVIITHPDFEAEANRLAQAHRENDFMTVAVVTTEQVYNEFSSGTPDATAYRWLMKMLYDRAIREGKLQDRPKYLLLFGRGTFDNRKILKNSKESGDNLVLTYQADNSLVKTLSYVTDDYFAFLDDSHGLQIPSHALRVGVGRFPVRTVMEANEVVTKNITYMQNKGKGIWKNQLCFVADDGDGALHMKQADSITNVIGRNHPNYIVSKIYLDSYFQETSATGKTYPLARTQLHNFIRNGVFMLNFTGHASNVGWTSEGILTSKDVGELSNKNLPIWVGATCDFLEFDVKTQSAGEKVLLNSAGGGIAILSAARPVYASQNFSMNRFFNEYAFKKVDGQHLRLGDIVRESKNRIGSEINKLSYVLMGNPALMLNYPTKYEIKTTHINNVDVNQDVDTLRATSVVNIRGFVADENANKVSTFNGEVNAIVFDKVQTITTRNNNNGGAMTYTDRPNILFSGKAEVVKGEFSLTFMMPKDIKYNFGAGRINLYAFDKDNKNDEAMGKFENFIVGGSSASFDETDNEGPEITAYLNTSNFKNGDKVNETPMFIAQLFDRNGINRVGSGIGHDLLLVVDNDSRQTYVLNDYFESSLTGFQNGEVRFKMPEMSNGKHTLTFRAWDLLNNSNTISIDFEVEKGLTPEIFRVRNFPNPVTDFTRIALEHDRPETILETQVEIFDLSGRLLWSFKQANADDITWDLQTIDGMKVRKGVYLYRVTVNAKNSERISKTNKMLVQ